MQAPGLSEVVGGWIVFSARCFASPPPLSQLIYISTALTLPLASDQVGNPQETRFIIHRLSSTEEEKQEAVMSSVSRASLVVAASISAVEALKDQAGLCRWNYVLRSVQQRAKNSVASMPQAKRASSSIDRKREWKGEEGRKKAKQSEEALRTVMYLSCWSPN